MTNKWLITGMIVLVAILIEAFHFGGTLSYQRGAILHGEIWRLLTGQLVHANWRHLAVDMAGLALWTALAGYLETTRSYLILLFGSALAVGSALLLFDPWLHGYLGFSGVLHALFAAAALRLTLRGEWLGGLALAAALALKIAWEQRYGDIGTAKLLGVPVVADSHLYGVLAGLAISILLIASRRG